MSTASTKQPAICGICPGGCAVDVSVSNGKLTGIKPLSGAPFSALCVRGAHATEVVYSPDRLQTPLLRTGARGKGEFRKASWDEALSFIAKKLLSIREHYGPQALASHLGRGAFEQSLEDLDGPPSGSKASNLVRLLGSPNVFSVSSICFTTFGQIAPMLTLGLQGRQLVTDWEKTTRLVIWGTNPATDSPPFDYHRILRLRSQGLKVILIDHMRANIADQADQWIAPRSGTDGALALGLIHLLIKEGTYDREFVAKRTTGFDELAAYVEQFTPEHVSHVTGVPADVIRELARVLAAEPAGLKFYTGLEYSNCGVQAMRAVFILWALAGHIDVPGGLLIQPKPDKWAAPQAVPAVNGVQPIGAAEYPVFHKYSGLAQFMEFPRAAIEGKPYPVKALINLGSSILTSYPQPAIFAEAFRKLDLLVVIDRFLTEDAKFADVVLPATTYFENTSYQRYPGYVRLRRPVIEPVGEARNDLLIIAALAAQLGLGDQYPQSDEEILTRAFARKPELLVQLKSSEDGVALPKREAKYRKYESGGLRADGQPGFETPSGKVEIASSVLAEHGYDALPVYTEPSEGPLGSPKLQKDFPLVLNTGARIHSTFRSQHLNIPGLVKRQPKPQVLIHPDDAEARGIADGDPVVVSTLRGEVRLYASVTERVVRGSVEANMGGGGPQQVPEWRGGNVNHITDFYNRDPISGFPTLKTLLCEITKAVEARKEIAV
jgi:anaerobic selenocysteine-containing dehydrogenase